MKTRFILFRRAGVFYYEDTVTRKQASLKTKDEAEARALASPKVQSQLGGNPPRKVIVVPDRLVNIVA